MSRWLERVCLRRVPRLLAALAILLAMRTSAQQPLTQSDVEAAYLFRFASFLRLPAQAAAAADTFDICILGATPLESRLREITVGERQNDRPVRVRRVHSAAEGRHCAVLFLADAEPAHIEQNLAELHGADTLTVSDAPQFLERGGMIQFVLQDQRVRFSVNLDAVGQTGITLSSELLRVAAKVQGHPGKEVRP